MCPTEQQIGNLYRVSIKRLINVDYQSFLTCGGFTDIHSTVQSAIPYKLPKTCRGCTSVNVRPGKYYNNLHWPFNPNRTSIVFVPWKGFVMHDIGTWWWSPTTTITCGSSWETLSIHSRRSLARWDFLFRFTRNRYRVTLSLTTLHPTRSWWRWA